MAMTEKYANFNLATGSNDGTSEANAWQSESDIVWAAGERVNLKCTTRAALGGDWAPSTDGDEVSGPIWLRGYTSTIGDGGKAYLGGTGTQRLDITGDKFILENIDFQTSQTYRAFRHIGYGGAVRNCVFTTSTTSISIDAFSLDRILVENCFFNASSVTTSNSTYGAVNAKGCIFTGNAVKAGNTSGLVLAGNAPDHIFGNVVYTLASNAHDGIRLLNMDSNGEPGILLNAIYGFDTGIMLDELDNAYTFGRSITHNIIVGAVTGIDTNDATNEIAVPMAQNAFYDCTTDVDSNIENNWPQIDKISLTADPFVDAANEDFSLNDTAGGGALLRGARGFAAGVFD